MAPQSYIVVLVALFAVQVIASSESKVDAPLDPIIHLVKTVLDYVNKLIDLAFEGSEHTLKNLLAQLDNIKAGALVLVEKQVQRESRILYELIETIKNRSGNTNIDILKCLQEIEAQAAATKQMAVNSSMSCIDSSIEATAYNMMRILADIKVINTDFGKQQQKLDDCKGKLFPFGCINAVVAEMGKVALTIPVKVTADANKAIFDFAAMSYEIFQCFRDSSNRMQEENVRIFNDFSQCVYDKEHPVKI